MRSKFLIVFLVFSIFMLTKPQAQFSVSLNIGLQPVWGPVGYDRVDNYYLPDIETYYSVPNRQFTYQVNGRWVTTYSLPPNHRGYDLYGGYKVVMSGSRPYENHLVNLVRYADMRNRHNQGVIRDSRDVRYFENKNHPRHGEWKGNGHDNRNKNEHGNKGVEHRDNGHDEHGHGDNGHGNHGRSGGEHGQKGKG